MGHTKNLLMSVLKSGAEGAASGAAVGSAISPGLGTLIGAGIGAISNIGISLFNNDQARKNASWQNELSKEQSAWMAQNMPMLTKAGLINAGISPAVAYEGSYNTASAAAPANPSPASPIDGIGLINNYLAAMQAKESVKKTALENDAIRIANEKNQLDLDIQRDEVEAWKEQGSTNAYFTTPEGKKLYRGTEEYNDYAEAHPNAKPEFIKTDEHMSERAYSIRVLMQDLRRKSAENQNYISKARLEQAVQDMQYADGRVVYALAHMDKQSYDNLNRLADKMILEKDIMKLNKILLENDVSNIEKYNEMLDTQVKFMKDNYESSKNTDVGKLITSLMSDGFSWKNLGLLVLAILREKVNGVTPQLGGASPSHNTTINIGGQ